MPLPTAENAKNYTIFNYVLASRVRYKHALWGNAVKYLVAEKHWSPSWGVALVITHVSVVPSRLVRLEQTF